MLGGGALYGFLANTSAAAGGGALEVGVEAVVAMSC